MTKMERPDFLKRNHSNGQTIIDAFRALSNDRAIEVDNWLVWARAYGSMTWQEICLYDWINESEEAELAFS